ncbi:hypothetical protein [Glaciecola punicea]|uniref:hypothetical protein n=1 Tax=Glaciecola punicea TaxID=56804 RepID=UPI001495ABE9|nr:hypothetical protein [Glaciecola punicea]
MRIPLQEQSHAPFNRSFADVVFFGGTSGSGDIAGIGLIFGAKFDMKSSITR